MPSAADITDALVSLVNDAGVPGADVIRIIVTLSPPALMMCYRLQDGSGDVSIVELAPVVVDLEQFAVQTDPP